MNETDHQHLLRCVELAEEALATNNDPFGSLIVSADGRVLHEDYNRTAGGDETRHPEFEIARWAAEHMTPQERSAATVYTSGEHCAMCSAAHAWVGLGRIVYALSSGELRGWRREWGEPPSPVNALPIQAVAPGVPVDGPDPALADRLRDLHHRNQLRKRG